MNEFCTELSRLINRLSLDTAAGMPDFIIASMIDDWVASFIRAQQEHQDWADAENSAQTGRCGICGSTERMHTCGGAESLSNIPAELEAARVVEEQ